MSYEHVRLTEADGVAELHLARPEKLNALSPQSLAELIDALDSVRDGATARALLITGEGRAFCSGADLSASGGEEGLRDRGAGLETGFNPLVERLAKLPIPVVVALNGAVAGGGVGLALMGDIVLAARSAYVLLPFVHIGLVPDVGATWLLQRLVGRARANAMMLLGERISADMAAEWGLIWRVVDDERLLEDARTVAARLAAGPTVALGLARRLTIEAADTSLAQALVQERDSQRVAGRTADHREGLAAFLERRAPQFSGR